MTTNGSGNYRAQIAAIRDEREKLLDKIRAIESASLPQKDALAAMLYDIKAKAARYRERADLLVQDWRRGNREPVHLIERILTGRGEPVAYPWQVENFLAFLFEEQIVETFTARIKALDFGKALAIEGRSEAIEKLKKEVVALEIREEALVKESEAAGIPIARRADVRGEVVLGLVGD
jgi:hypothetical protein